jgi:hypothetical protein
MTIRAPFEVPGTPEKIKSASIADLVEILLKKENRNTPLDMSEQRPVAYIPVGESALLKNVIDLRPLRANLQEIELLSPHNIDGPLLFRKHRYKKILAEAAQKTTIPDDAQLVHLAYYLPAGGDIQGPQLSDKFGANWSFTIDRTCLVLAGKQDKPKIIDGSTITDIHTHETYQDDNGKIVEQASHDSLTMEELRELNNPELLAMLQVVATHL